MQPKQLTPTELIAVSVPGDAKENYLIAHEGDTYVKNFYGSQKVGNGTFEILGTVTADTIDFDVACLYGITPKEFRIILSANGLHFTNPNSAAENNLIEKLVILKKI